MLGRSPFGVQRVGREILGVVPIAYVMLRNLLRSFALYLKCNPPLEFLRDFIKT